MNKFLLGQHSLEGGFGLNADLISDLVVGADVFDDGGFAGTPLLSQRLDGCLDHAFVGRVAGDLLGCGGLLGFRSSDLFGGSDGGVSHCYERIYLRNLTCMLNKRSEMS